MYRNPICAVSVHVRGLIIIRFATLPYQRHSTDVSIANFRTRIMVWTAMDQIRAIGSVISTVECHGFKS